MARWVVRKMGISDAVSMPGGRPLTGGTTRGWKEMRAGWRLEVCNWSWALFGSKNEILWPLLASSLDRYRNGVMWPYANHGNMAMCNFESLGLAIFQMGFL